MEEYDNVLNISLKVIFLSMKCELKQMSKQDSKGTIVNCSPMGGLVGIAGCSAYHTAKHGVLGLTKSSGLEYAKAGIRINAVCPGIIETPMLAGMEQTEKSAMDDLIKAKKIQSVG